MALDRHLRIDSQEGISFVRNIHLDSMEEDVLYHLALSNKSHDLKEIFGDVKFVCFGGSPSRMEKFAHYMVDQLKFKLTPGQTLYNISKGSDRYVLYKMGPIISVSHGMGIPSLSILIHEILKLLQHAGCDPSEVVFFRLGTSGGLGLDAGTVVISEAAVDGILRSYMEIPTLGLIIQHPAKLDEALNKELLQISEEIGCKSELGKTMCTYDFYEGAVLCVTLLNRLNGDQINTPHDVMEEWQARPQRIVAAYIKKKLGMEYKS